MTRKSIAERMIEHGPFTITISEDKAELCSDELEIGGVECDFENSTDSGFILYLSVQDDGLLLGFGLVRLDTEQSAPFDEDNEVFLNVLPPGDTQLQVISMPETT